VSCERPRVMGFGIWVCVSSSQGCEVASASGRQWLETCHAMTAAHFCKFGNKCYFIVFVILTCFDGEGRLLKF
jgi:hypothetical protein